jgi:pimeloyl-ACP methyl ester carboxylesterase
VPDTPENRARRAATEVAFASALRVAAGPHGLATTFEYDGDPEEPAHLVCHAASPGGSRPRATLVFLHGKGGFAAEWRRDAVRALRLGYDVLVPELRGHPPSGGARITYGLREVNDLVLLAGEAARRFGFDPSRLGLDGASMGALVALRAAAVDPRVRALWLRSPFADLPAMAEQYVSLATGLPRLLVSLPVRIAVARAGRAAGLPLTDLDPLAAARRVSCPVLVVHGEEDELVPVGFARPLFAALSGEKELWIVPRAGHEHHADEPSGLRAADYARRWSGFFTRHLPAAGTAPAPVSSPSPPPSPRGTRAQRPRRPQGP